MLTGAGALAVVGAGWWGYSTWERQAAEQDILAWMKDNTRRFEPVKPASIMADGAMVKALAGAPLSYGSDVFRPTGHRLRKACDRRARPHRGPDAIAHAGLNGDPPFGFSSTLPCRRR
jgi:hypothetical protein